MALTDIKYGAEEGRSARAPKLLGSLYFGPGYIRSAPHHPV